MSDLFALRVLVVDHDTRSRDELANELNALGFVVVDAPTALTSAPPEADVVIVDVTRTESGSALDALPAIRAAFPAIAVVLCTSHETEQLGADDAQRSHAAALLLKPIPVTVLDATVRLAALRARELAEAREEAAQAKSQLEARKLIERAKGILMRRTGSSEQEAYRIMQRTSQDKSVPMVNIAKAVLDSEPGLHHVS
jgi:response regulator NasT